MLLNDMLQATCDNFVLVLTKKREGFLIRIFDKNKAQSERVNAVGAKVYESYKRMQLNEAQEYVKQKARIFGECSLVDVTWERYVDIAENAGLPRMNVSK